MGARLAFIAGIVALLLVASPQFALAQAPSSSGVGTIVVPPGTTSGSISLSAGEVRIFGTVDGNVSVGVGEVDITGTVTGNVHVGVGRIVATTDASVGGTSSEGLGQIRRLNPGQPLPPLQSPGPGMVVTDRVTAGHLFWPGLVGLIGLGPGGILSVGISRLLAWLVGLGFALVLFALFPKAVESIAGAVERTPGPSVGWSVVLLLAAPPALVILTITVVGIPAVFVAALALLAAKAAGYVAASLIIGRRLGTNLGHGRLPAIPWQIVLGTVLLFVVGSVPVVGFLLDLTISAFSLGAVALTGFGSGRPWFRRPVPGA